MILFDDFVCLTLSYRLILSARRISGVVRVGGRVFGIDRKISLDFFAWSLFKRKSIPCTLITLPILLALDLGLQESVIQLKTSRRIGL
jgi:hypothetical protein